MGEGYINPDVPVFLVRSQLNSFNRVQNAASRAALPLDTPQNQVGVISVKSGHAPYSKKGVALMGLDRARFRVCVVWGAVR